RTGTKSLTPSAEASMQEQRTSPPGSTTARGPTAMAPGPRVAARCVTKPSRRGTKRMRELDRGQRGKSQGREQANGHTVRSQVENGGVRAGEPIDNAIPACDCLRRVPWPAQECRCRSSAISEVLHSLQETQR